MPRLHNLDTFQTKLLQGWEEVYRKGQLTFWILFSLSDHPKHMSEIKSHISELTQDSILPDDKSMYRALRRLKDGLLIEVTSIDNHGAPDLKQYSLTHHGWTVLSAFAARNINQILYDKHVMTRIKDLSNNYERNVL